MQNIVPPLANVGPTLDASSQTTKEIGIASALDAAQVSILSCATIAVATDFTKTKITNCARRSTTNALVAMVRAHFLFASPVESIVKRTRWKAASRSKAARRSGSPLTRRQIESVERFD